MSFGGKETPLAGAQGGFLPPKPPILPPTRFYLKYVRFGDVAAFLVTSVPRCLGKIAGVGSPRILRSARSISCFFVMFFAVDGRQNKRPPESL